MYFSLLGLKLPWWLGGAALIIALAKLTFVIFMIVAAVSIVCIRKEKYE